MLIFFLLVIYAAGEAQATEQTFTNPLLPSGADPFSFYKDGYYYYTHTTGNRIVLWKTKNLANLKTAEQKTIFTPPQGTDYSKEIWAPEIHFINDKWYAYFAADDGNNNNHRMYVLENASADPMQGDWIFKGKVADPSDKWAIDGDVFIHGKQLYMIWSGWEGDHNGQQNIYIAKMKNPWTIEGKRVQISSPAFDWETIGDLNDANNPPHVNVNEGPQVLRNGNKLFIVYSASGCWTDSYALGFFHLPGKNNLLDSTKWKKSTQPVLNNQKKKVCMHRDIIHFLNHPMAKKIGYCIMLIQNPDKVAEKTVHQEHKNFHGKKMEHPTLVNRLQKILYWLYRQK